MPDWITHVAVVEEQRFQLIARSDYSPHSMSKTSAVSSMKPVHNQSETKEPLMDLKGVRIQYDTRKVSLHSCERKPL